LVLRRVKSKKSDVLASAPAMTVGIETQEYKPPVTSGKRFILAGAVVLALALLIPVYQARSQAHAAANSLGQELAVLEGELRESQIANAAIVDLSLETRNLGEERRSVLGYQGKFSQSLSQLPVGLPRGAVPGSLNMSDENLILNGTAKDHFQVIELADQIERFGLFDGVYLESIPTGATDGSNSNIYRIRADYRGNETGDGRE
jgi:hypothetical protein